MTLIGPGMLPGLSKNGLQNLDITNKFLQSLGTSLNRGSTVFVSCFKVVFYIKRRSLVVTLKALRRPPRRSPRRLLHWIPSRRRRPGRQRMRWRDAVSRDLQESGISLRRVTISPQWSRFSERRDGTFH